MSYSVEELKVMLKKALAAAKANRLNLEEVLEENSILRAQVAGLQARVSQQDGIAENIAIMAENSEFSAGKQNSMEYMMYQEHNRRNR